MLQRCLPGALVLVLVGVTPTMARQTPAAPPAQQPEQKPEQVQAPEESPVYKEQVVVTASKTEQALVNAPATVSLIAGETLQNNASTSYADLFRAVPGLNVTQTSARDINLTSRGATSTLSTSQLALVDGRSIYLDFFGFIAWDFLPVNPAEIKQIEVIRGPASAIWGANAMNGVVNVITKSPRELPGTNVTLGVGTFGREVSGGSQDNGMLFYANGSHAQIVSDRWAYKVSAGVYSQDPLARPTGNLPSGLPYPAFANEGTTQPKLDVRADYDFEDGQRKLVFQGGVAGTEGILHSGIGPFDINSGTVLGYGKVNYSKGAMKLNFFTNILNGDATNLLAVGLNGQPLNFIFKSNTYDLEFGDVRTFQQRHVVSYGGNFRFSNFDLSIAPAADSRKEGGALPAGRDLPRQVRPPAARRARGQVRHHRGRAVLAADDADAQADAGSDHPPVVQPRLPRAVGHQQLPRHHDHQPVAAGLDQPGASAAPSSTSRSAPSAATSALAQAGSRRRTWWSSRLPAYEIGYTGVIKQRATVSAAFYFNETKDDIFFTQIASYRAANPPPRMAAAADPAVPGRSSSRALLPAWHDAKRGASVPVRRRQRPAVGVQLPQPRQGGAEGAGAGHRRRLHEGVERVCQLLVPARPEGHRLSAVGDQPAAQQPLQRRRELRRGRGIWAAWPSATRTRRTGRTCSTTAMRARPIPSPWSTAPSASSGAPSTTSSRCSRRPTCSTTRFSSTSSGMCRSCR